MKEPSISRRSFIQASGFSLVLLGLGGTVKWSGREDNFLRPPGADSAQFLAKCLKCQKCLQVCLPKIITPVPLTDSVLSGGTPILDFKLGYCDFCLKCAAVCPTGALTMTGPTASNIGKAEIQKNSCVAWDWGGCINCYEQCPEKAIRLDEHQRPVIDEQKCNGCGLCEFICPSASMRSYNNAVGQKGIIVINRQVES